MTDLDLLTLLGYTQNNDSNDASATTVPSYNPAALLNPRGFNGVASNNAASNPYFGSSGSSTPISFSFSSPNEQLDLPLHQASYSHPPNGFSGMIERVNNVDDRMFVPQQKRRRVEPEGNTKQNASFGMNGSGMMSQHIKDKREGGPAQNGVTNYETVDLTDGGERVLFLEVVRILANSVQEMMQMSL